MKINLFKTKKSFKKKSTEPNPNFYWKIIIACTFLLILASFVFDYYVFIQVKDESTFAPETATQKQPIEKQRIETILEYFSLREKNSAKILNSPTTIVDPSL